MSQLSIVNPKIAPAAANPLTLTSGATAWASGAYVEFIASTAAPITILGITSDGGGTASAQIEFDIAKGAAGVEVVVATVRWFASNPAAASNNYYPLLIPISGIGAGERVSLRVRKHSGTALPVTCSLTYAENWDANAESYALKCVPSAANGVTITPNGTAWANSAYVELTPGITNPIGIAGLSLNRAVVGVDYEIDIATGPSGTPSVITTIRGSSIGTSTSGALIYDHLPAIYEVAANTRISVRIRKTGTSGANWTAALLYYDLPSGPGVTTDIKQIQGAESGGATVSRSITVSAGSAILVMAYSFLTTSYTVASDVGGALTLVTLTNGTTGNYYQPTGLYAVTAWLLTNATAGTHVITLSGGNVNSLIGIIEIEVSGGVTVQQHVATGFITDTASFPTMGYITTTEPSCIIAGFIHSGNAGWYAGGPSFMPDFLSIPDPDYLRNAAIEAKLVGSAGLYGADFTSENAVSHEGVCVALKLVSASAVTEKTQTYIWMPV